MDLFPHQKTHQIKCYGRIKTNYIEAFPKTIFFDASTSGEESIKSPKRSCSIKEKKNFISKKCSISKRPYSRSKYQSKSLFYGTKSIVAKKQCYLMKHKKVKNKHFSQDFSKNNLCLSIIQPNWDSILEYSLCVEKVHKKNIINQSNVSINDSSLNKNKFAHYNKLNPSSTHEHRKSATSFSSNCISRNSICCNSNEKNTLSVYKTNALSSSVISNFSNISLSVSENICHKSASMPQKKNKNAIQTSTPLTSSCNQKQTPLLNISRISLYGKHNKKQYKKPLFKKQQKKTKNDSSFILKTNSLKNKETKLVKRYENFLTHSRKEHAFPLDNNLVTLSDTEETGNIEMNSFVDISRQHSSDEKLNYLSQISCQSGKHKLLNIETYEVNFPKPCSLTVGEVSLHPEMSCSVNQPAGLNVFSPCSSFAHQSNIRTNDSFQKASWLPAQTTHSNLELKCSYRKTDCIRFNKYEIPSDSLIRKLLEECDQEEVFNFSDLYDWNKTAVRKIGEGTYGEVFIITFNKKSTVIKVIPMSDDIQNAGTQSFDSVLSEVKVAKCLCKLRKNSMYCTKNFSYLKSVRLAMGSYPSKMKIAWDEFSEAKTSYNYRPDIFSEDQVYAILELEFGGKDLTDFVIKNAVEAEAIFKQIAVSLAIAEDAHMFEHRDLHPGNILVQRNKSKHISYIFRGKSIRIQTFGLCVTIIDFTLSRVMDSGCIYYNNLATDESLFNQTGDIQFEVYRVTRLHLKNDWQECLLYSNVLWLIFLCKKFQDFNYSRPSTAAHQRSLETIKLFLEKMAPCTSALECLVECNLISSVSKRNQAQDSIIASTIYIDRKSLQKSVSYAKE